MSKSIKIILYVVVIISVILAVLSSIKLYQHRQGVAEAGSEYRNYDPPSITDFGSTSELSVLPLINWHTDAPNLKT
ncbi:MAG: hypothetical protein R3220_12690 [Balneolaceae bacterium]|nr:hypothetical protein [Balneolaceae bacterium]